MENAYILLQSEIKGAVHIHIMDNNHSEKFILSGKVNGYMICTSKLPAFQSVEEYREFAEKIVGGFGYKMIRFGAWFPSKQAFGHDKVYQYSKSKKTFFDEIPLSEFGGIDFTGTKGKEVGDLNLDFAFTDFEEYLMRTTLVFEDDISSLAVLMNYVNRFLTIFQQTSEVSFLIADRMNVEKWVSTFALGIGYGGRARSSYENEVANSISASKRNHKLPYLFVYNYMKTAQCMLPNIPKEAEYLEENGYVTLSFPRCFGKELEQYPTFSEWRSVYRELQAKGEIAVTDELKKLYKLKEMIDEIMAQER